jgi:hypothetical protein
MTASAGASFLSDPTAFFACHDRIAAVKGTHAATTNNSHPSRACRRRSSANAATAAASVHGSQNTIGHRERTRARKATATQTIPATSDCSPRLYRKRSQHQARIVSHVGASAPCISSSSSGDLEINRSIGCHDAWSLDLHEIRAHEMSVGESSLQIFRAERPENLTSL